MVVEVEIKIEALTNVLVDMTTVPSAIPRPVFLIVAPDRSLPVFWYAQTVSEQIPKPSPKKQLDSGMAPHDVICRDGLVLVESSTNQIECTHETTAQKMGWRVISQPIPILEKTNVSLSNAYNSNEMITTLENPLYSLPAPRNASFNVTFPNSVSINETFDIEYVWIADPRYGTPSNINKKNSTVISMIALEIEHVNLKSNGSDFSFSK